MKKNIFIIILYLICLNKLTAQVLYTENFDNLNLGNLGTDVTGSTTGQGGWFTTGATNAQYVIISEPLRGNILSVFTNNPQLDQQFYVEKRDLNTLIDKKNTGNNVMKVEFDFYTGSKSTIKSSRTGSGIAFTFNPPQNYSGQGTELIRFHFSHDIGTVNIFAHNGKRAVPISSPFFNFDTWYTLIFYLDYTNKKCYLEISGINFIFKGDFLNNVTPTDFKLSKIGLSMSVYNLISTSKREHRYDNIKISAIKSVPSYLLDTEDFISKKFNMYPNPATKLVSITNNENMLVEKITVYDVTGKEISVQLFNNEKEIQFNVENLASGNYMLHLQTNKGLAVKKLVKN